MPLLVGTKYLEAALTDALGAVYGSGIQVAVRSALEDDTTVVRVKYRGFYAARRVPGHELSRTSKTDILYRLGVAAKECIEQIQQYIRLGREAVDKRNPTEAVKPEWGEEAP